MTDTVVPYNPRMQVSYFTARQHAIAHAYIHQMRHTTEEALNRLDTEHDDEVYRRVCRQFGFDPLELQS